MVFSRSNKLGYPRKIKMEGQEIEYSTDTRYLGVQLDSKPLWTLHFNKVATKAKQYLMHLMGALNKRWGPKPKLVRWIYTFWMVNKNCSSSHKYDENNAIFYMWKIWPFFLNVCFTHLSQICLLHSKKNIFFVLPTLKIRPKLNQNGADFWKMENALAPKICTIMCWNFIIMLVGCFLFLKFSKILTF